jgi:hypothetical protein
MNKTPSEVYQAMSATNILVAILQSQKTISIPLSIFLEASQQDQELSVEYDEESSSFLFELKEKDERQDDQKNVEPNSNE